tara:strand:- start:3533 stop:3763 length:231 start_codon:yes stop_codon:yes gene_type:complete
MKEYKENKKWEVSIMEIRDNGARFKVTRRVPEMGVAETKLFNTKEEAKQQFDQWLTSKSEYSFTLDFKTETNLSSL